MGLFDGLFDSPGESGTYVDKQRGEIEKDVRKSFERNDDFFIRDDQEIYQAGLRTIRRYRNEVLNSDRLVLKERYILKDGKPVLFTYQNEYWKAAKKYFTEAYNKIVDLHNNVTGWIKFTTDAEDDDLIRRVAIDIDNAENEALRKIEQYCNPMEVGDNASYHSSLRRDNKGTPVVENGQIMVEKPMFTQSRNGVIAFTDKCNNMSFLNIANSSGLFYLTRQRQYPQYTIDYTNCKNQRLKDKMRSLMGGYRGTLYYDATKKTYFIKGNNGTVVNASSIGIWEGVTFKRKEIEADEAHEEDLKRRENIGRLDAEMYGGDSPENDPELKKIVDDIPEDLRKELRKLGVGEYRKFIIKTENRLAAILREYKYYNYELHTNPVSTSYSGLFEINFISRDYEKSVDLREDLNTDLGPSLSSLFTVISGQNSLYVHHGSRSYKSEYKKYLEKRIQAKWNEVDELASRENLIGMDYVRNPNLGEDEKLSLENLSSINYGIYLLKTFIQNHREKEGNSHIDSDDTNLTGMWEDLQNLESTIQRDGSLVSKHTIFSIINDTASKLSERWYKYTYGIQYKRYLYNDFKSIIMSDDNNIKFKTLKNLGYRSFGTDGTTSFLAEEMGKSDVKEITLKDEDGNEEKKSYAESRLQISDSELNRRFQFINSCLYTDIEFDSNGNLVRTPAMDKIDNLYKSCGDSSGKKMAEELKNMGILPDSWVDDSDVLDKCREIVKNLKKKEENISKNFTVDVVRKGVSDQRLKLESKYPRTQEEEDQLRKIKYYDEHPDEAVLFYTESLECMKSMIRYYGINNEISCPFASVFVEEGGGASGQMGEMYNDIVGYGFWDLSDKTATVLKNIAVTIVVSVIAGFAISSFVSFLSSFFVEHFPGLVKILQSIKAAVSSRVANVVSLGGIKGRMAQIGVEILKRYDTGLVGVRNVFISNFRAGVPLDGGFGLEHHALDSVLIMSIAYFSGCIGQFGQLFGDKITKCLESVFVKFAEHPERGDNVVNMAGSVTELASKEGLKSIKNIVLSSGTEDITIEADLNKGLCCLDENIWSSDDKKKLSESAESRVKFKLSADVVDDSSLSLSGMKKSICAADVLSVFQNLLAFKAVKHDDEIFKKIVDGKLMVHLGAIPGKVYLQNPATGEIALLSDLATGRKAI